MKRSGDVRAGVNSNEKRVEQGFAPATKYLECCVSQSGRCKISSPSSRGEEFRHCGRVKNRICVRGRSFCRRGTRGIAVAFAIEERNGHRGTQRSGGGNSSCSRHLRDTRHRRVLLFVAVPMFSRMTPRSASVLISCQLHHLLLSRVLSLQNGTSIAATHPMREREVLFSGSFTDDRSFDRIGRVMFPRSISFDGRISSLIITPWT